MLWHTRAQEPILGASAQDTFPGTPRVLSSTAVGLAACRALLWVGLAGITLLRSHRRSHGPREEAEGGGCLPAPHPSPVPSACPLSPEKSGVTLREIPQIPSAHAALLPCHVLPRLGARVLQPLPHGLYEMFLQKATRFQLLTRKKSPVLLSRDSLLGVKRVQHERAQLPAWSEVAPIGTEPLHQAGPAPSFDTPAVL